MKTKSIVPLLLVALSCCFVSCDTFGKRMFTPIQRIEVIKFKKPEYKDYIMAVLPSNDAEILTYNGKFQLPVSVQNLYGQSPYIELGDDYLLIDWRWSQVYYPWHEAVITEKWRNFQHDPNVKYPEWPMDMLLAKYPVAEYYTFTTKRIDEYLYGEVRNEIGIINEDMSSEKEWAEADESLKELWREYIAFNDSMYRAYTPALRQIIKEGKMDEYGYKLDIKKY